VLILILGILTMTTICWVISSVLILFAGLSSIPGLVIDLPAEGSEVQGIVEIKGSIPEGNFLKADLSYAYTDSTDANWFLISDIDQPVKGGLLANWDTTTISDGLYNLRLHVQLRNGEQAEVIVKKIRVMNYSRPGVSTETVPTQGMLSSEPVSTSEANIELPTAFPPNPASMDANQLRTSVFTGVLVSVIILAFLGIYTLIRKFPRRR
jgi:hypothetical protein